MGLTGIVLAIVMLFAGWYIGKKVKTIDVNKKIDFVKENISEEASEVVDEIKDLLK